MRIRSILLLASASLLVTATASAAQNNEDNKSTASAALKWQTRDPIVGPTSGLLGNTTLGVEFSANLDPVADPQKPLLLVDMPKGATLEATWGDGKSINLKVADGGGSDATFKVQHTLAPHVKVMLNVLSFNLTYDYTATALINAIPGSQWNYEGLGQAQFAPWGWTPANLRVTAPPLNQAQIFSIAFPQLGNQPILGGNLAINATTSPTFAYTTTEVLVASSSIKKQGGTWSMPTTDDDYLELPVVVKGEISYKGSILVRPSVTITSIGNTQLPLPLTLDIPQAGVDLAYESGNKPIAVTFPTTMFHIPLPNVKVDRNAVDLGGVKLGETAKKQTEIKNTGELGASFTFTSSDPQFVVISAKQYAQPKSKYDLDIQFTPEKEGQQEATITVASNDPNEPTQVIKVRGTGIAPTAAPAPGGDPAAQPPQSGGGGDSGCGCRVGAPTTSDALGFGLFAVAFAAIRRRRQR
jgi:MYXO-CTERM domain-containing protein